MSCLELDNDTETASHARANVQCVCGGLCATCMYARLRIEAALVCVYVTSRRLGVWHGIWHVARYVAWHVVWKGIWHPAWRTCVCIHF